MTPRSFARAAALALGIALAPAAKAQFAGPPVHTPDPVVAAKVELLQMDLAALKEVYRGLAQQMAIGVGNNPDQGYASQQAKRKAELYDQILRASKELDRLQYEAMGLPPTNESKELQPPPAGAESTDLDEFIPDPGPRARRRAPSPEELGEPVRRNDDAERPHRPRMWRRGTPPPDSRLLRPHRRQDLPDLGPNEPRVISEPEPEDDRQALRAELEALRTQVQALEAENARLRSAPSEQPPLIEEGPKPAPSPGQNDPDPRSPGEPEPSPMKTNPEPALPVLDDLEPAPQPSGEPESWPGKKPEPSLPPGAEGQPPANNHDLIPFDLPASEPALSTPTPSFPNPAAEPSIPLPTTNAVIETAALPRIPQPDGEKAEDRARLEAIERKLDRLLELLIKQHEATAPLSTIPNYN